MTIWVGDVCFEDITAADWDVDTTVWRALTDKGLIFAETPSGVPLELVVAALKYEYEKEDV